MNGRLVVYFSELETLVPKCLKIQNLLFIVDYVLISFVDMWNVADIPHR